MNKSIEVLAKEIITNIIHDIGSLEKEGSVKFTLTKADKWSMASKWLEETKQILTNSIVKDQAYTAAFDGGATPNPGNMKIGGWIRDPQGSRIYAYTEEIGHGTNNEAEYSSLLKLLEEVQKRGIKKIHIQGDSALVVNQVNGNWKAKDPRMKLLKDKAVALSQGLDCVLEHVVRKFNSEADSLT
jgi:ribonuclease HI